MSSLGLFEAVRQAYIRVQGHIHHTPVLTCSTLDQMVGRQVFFKCENLQKTGAFKARGALNAVLKLKENNPDSTGVVTHSSGNHGQALAWAANVAGFPCSVIVPRNTSPVKIDAIQNYGAKLFLCEPTPQSREETCAEVAQDTGQVFIPPFDHYDVIAGQGTMSMELLEQVPDLDAILVPISGGGMISGIAIAAKSIQPQCKVFAVEPQGKDLEPSLRAGKRLWEPPDEFIPTIAEGICRREPGLLTFPILVELIEKGVFTVTDDEMISAVKFIMQRMKLVIETSSGAGVAAVMSEKMKAMDPSLKKIGVILCGGNIDINDLPW